MTPENLVINDGFRTIRIDVYNEHLTKKPTCRITCAESCTPRWLFISHNKLNF